MRREMHQVEVRCDECSIECPNDYFTLARCQEVPGSTSLLVDYADGWEDERHYCSWAHLASAANREQGAAG